MEYNKWRILCFVLHLQRYCFFIAHARRRERQRERESDNLIVSLLLKCQFIVQDSRMHLATKEKIYIYLHALCFTSSYCRFPLQRCQKRRCFHAIATSSIIYMTFISSQAEYNLGKRTISSSFLIFGKCESELVNLFILPLR